MRHDSRWAGVLALLTAAVLVGCEPQRTCEGDWCGTLVMVSGAEPASLMPVIATFDVEVALADLLYWKLADAGQEPTSVGDAGFEPELAARWQFEDSLTLVFTMNPEARWQDGVRVTAHDVAFSFDLVNDPQVNSIFRSRLARIRSVTARDSGTAVFRFTERYPEQFFDAVFHMRIMPRHLLEDVSRTELGSHPLARNPVGNGPFRFVRWQSGEFVELVADTMFFGGRPGVRRIIWRFAPDPIAAVTELVAGDVDVLNIVPGPEQVARVEARPDLRIVPAVTSSIGFVGFNFRDPSNLDQPHPLFRDRELRRALAMAVNREAVVRAVFGEYAEVPNAPVSRVEWVWADDLQPPAYDTAAARQALAELGWIVRDNEGYVVRSGERLSFELLVPSSSAVRVQSAVILQDQFKRAGVEMTIRELEFNTWSDLTLQGRFDASFQSNSHDPSPAAVAQEWTRDGFGEFNRGRYANPGVETLVAEAMNSFDGDTARAKWREALGIINDDAPGIWIFLPTMTAGVHERFENVAFDAFEWWKNIWTWQVTPGRWIDRDLIAPN